MNSGMVREDSDVALEASHFAFLQQNKNILANNVLWKRKVCFHFFPHIFSYIEYMAYFLMIFMFLMVMDIEKELFILLPKCGIKLRHFYFSAASSISFY